MERRRHREGALKFEPTFAFEPAELAFEIEGFVDTAGFPMTRRRTASGYLSLNVSVNYRAARST